MADIPTLINEKRYKEIAQQCELMEIQNATDGSHSLEQIYPVYLATCILTEDLTAARYVRKRILSNNVDSPEINAMWSVVVALIKKEYPQVYEKLDSYTWSEYVAPLIEPIKSNTRDAMFRLISSIYTSIELSQASRYFGLPEAALLQELKSKGWEYNETTHVLQPLKPVPAPYIKPDVNRFATLSDIVLNLEKF